MSAPVRPPWYFLLLLILAGEAVFILPFVLPRVFRPTVLETFGIDNTQLGLCMSGYGLVALVAYLFGGPLADRYAPRKLIAVGLWLTAAGGLYQGTYPGYSGLRWVYAYWGFTTIFLFWAPMIKATRVWGGQHAQGRAFGLLDGGRGGVGALIGSVGVVILGAFLTQADGAAAAGEARAGFRQILLAASGFIVVVGGLAWRYLRLPPATEEAVLRRRITASEVGTVLRLPAVLLLMVIILCAYTGYKVSDVFSLYAREVLGYDQVRAAGVGSLLLYVRPVVGISVGFLADRTQVTRWLLLTFVLTGLGSLLFATGVVGSVPLLFLVGTLTVSTGVYAARALYFAVMERGRIPLALTGTAVGLISLVGYTPDIFMGPAMGYFLDGFPGVTGQRYVFWMTAGFSTVGALAAWAYHRRFGRPAAAGTLP